MSAWGDNAIVSNSGTYRYQLQRDLEHDNELTCLFIMLNPSTADATKNDPTLRRCMGFAERWGFGRLEVVNLFSLRATDPARLCGRPAQQLYGPEHWKHFSRAVKRADRIVCGWGAHPACRLEGPSAAEWLHTGGHKPLCLGLTKAGAPRHPLYVKGDTVPYLLELGLPS